MSHSRLIFAAATGAPVLLALGWVLGGGPGAATLAALALAGLLSGLWLGRAAGRVHFAGPEATPWTAPMLVHTAHRLAEAAGLPRPRLYVLPSEEPNAQSDTDAQGPRIAVSTALLRRLRPEELAAVIAHELAHARGRDARRLGWSALALTGASLGLDGLLLALVQPHTSFAGTVLLLLPACLTAAWAQMALCRAREFRADAVAAALCGHPQWIVAALRRVDGADEPAAFDTHPSVPDRIARLRTMASPWP